jgi:hypothetical protein
MMVFKLWKKRDMWDQTSDLQITVLHNWLRGICNCKDNLDSCHTNIKKFKDYFF